MTFLINLLKGLAIGIGSIAPGVSGGSLAVVFGVYERITGFVAHFIKRFKDDFLFLLPIGIGAIVGIFGFSHIMEYLFANYELQVKYLFIGLILGTVPFTVKDANSKGFKKQYIIPLVLAVAVTVTFAFFDSSTLTAVASSNGDFFLLLISGVVLGFGTIIPGISASFILMYLGTYDRILAAVSNIDIMAILPIGIGFIASVILFAKLINLLFEKWHGYTYYAVIGFVIGSVVPIFPGFNWTLEYLLCVSLLIVGFLFSYLFGRFAVKH